MVVEWYHISDAAENNDQTRLEKDGMDVENTSVTGSSKQPTLLDTSLLKKNGKITLATKTVLELPCEALKNALSHLPRLSSLGECNII